MDPPPSSPPRTAPSAAALAGLLPLLTLPALLAVTSGEVAVPPRWLVLAAAALLLAVVLGVGGARPRPWLDLPLAAGIGLVAEHLLLAPGLPRAHDTITHLWGISALAQEVAAGDLFPRWVHDLELGIPLLQFYGPGSFLLPLLLSLAGASPARALAGTFALLGALAAAAMYAAVVRWTGDRRAGLLAATAYAFAPYRLLDGHYRAALAESTALALLPLVFLAGLAAAREPGRRRLAMAAAAFALLIVTHPLSAVMAALGLLVWAGVEAAAAPAKAERRAGRTRVLFGGAGRLAAGWVLGAALAGFFTLPFAVELRTVEVAGLARGEQRQLYVAHGVAPDELWRRRLWSELRLSQPAGTESARSGAEMPFYFGLVLLALALLAAAPTAQPAATRAPPWAPWAPFLLCAVALALTLRPVAAAASLAVPPLAVLQFPWRFLGLATFAAAAGAGLAVARLLAVWQGRRWAALVPGVFAVLLILDAAPYTGAAEWFPPYRGLVRIRWPAGEAWQPAGRAALEPVAPPYPFRVAGYFLPPPEREAQVSLFCCAYPEYVTPAVRRSFFPPRDPAVLARAGVGLAGWETGPLVRLSPRPYAFWRPEGGGRLEPRPARRAGGEIVVALDGRPGTVVVLEQAYPGWRVWTAAGWRAAQATRGGLLRVAAAPGQREARLRFGSTWDRTAGWLLTAAALLGLSWAVAPRRAARAGRGPRRG